MVEYAGDVTYNETVASDPKNGEMKVRWDSRGTDIVSCSQCISLDRDSSIEHKRPTRRCVAKVSYSYNEESAECGQQPVQHGGGGQGNSRPGKFLQSGEC